MTSAFVEIPCPTGLTFMARPIGGAEIISIADRAGQNAGGELLGQVLGGCMQEITNPGPYPFVQKGVGKPPWMRLAWGDLVVAIIRLRIASFRKIRGQYEFDFSCQFDDCKKLAPWSVDLELLLASSLYKPITDETAEVIRASGSFAHKLDSGIAVHFDIARGEQDKPMRELMKREGRSKETDVERVAKQLVYVEGFTNAKSGELVRDPRALWQWAKRLDIGDLDDLLRAYDEKEPGIDTELRVTCKHCGREQDVNLPLGRSFFRPRTATRTATTASDELVELSFPESRSPGGAPSSKPSAGTNTGEAASPASPTPISSG